MTKTKETKDNFEELEKRIAELTEDLQRTRADFENYRKRVESEKIAARESGEMKAILKLLPVVDTIERAIGHLPDELQDHKWVQGIAGVAKNLDKTLEGLNLKRIEASKGTDFNPDLHEAIQFDEDAKGEREVIEEELQPGYTWNGRPLRHAMVKVTKE